ESKRIRAGASSSAVSRARAAAVVDLPACRLHSKRIWRLVERSRSACQGSGTMPARTMIRARSAQSAAVSEPVGRDRASQPSLAQAGQDGMVACQSLLVGESAILLGPVGVGRGDLLRGLQPEDVAALVDAPLDAGQVAGVAALVLLAEASLEALAVAAGDLL